MAIEPRRTAAGRLAERPGILFLGLFLLVSLTLVVPRITADGVAYFAEARSLLFDGDLDLANEYAVDPERYSPLADPGPRAFLPRDDLGRFEHNVNVGIVILFAPFLVAAHLLTLLAAGMGAPVLADGFDRTYALAIAFGTNAMVAGGVLLLVRYAARIVGAAPAAVGGIAGWLGTSVLYWAAFRPAHAHAPAVLLEAGFVVLFLTRGRDPTQRLIWLLLGALAGLMLSVRPVAGLYSVVPALYLGFLAARWLNARRAGLISGTTLLTAGGLFVAGTFIGRLPQFVFARDFSLVGTSFYSDTGYLEQGLQPDPLGGVVSLFLDPAQGVAWWAPLVPLSLIGMLAFWHRDRLTTVACAIWALTILGFLGFLGVPERFGGFAFESRHLVELTPVFILGTIGLVRMAADRLRRIAARPPRLVATVGGAALLGLLVSWNVLAHVAGLIAQVSGSGAVERVARLLARPEILGRLYLERQTLEAPEGRVYLGGRLLEGLLSGQGQALTDVLLYGALAAFLGGLVLGGATLAWRWVSARVPADADASTGASRGWLLAWAVPLWLLATLLAPALGPPTRVGVAGDVQVLHELEVGDSSKPPGTLASVRIGDSAAGNAVLTPPPPAPEEIIGASGPIGYQALEAPVRVALPSLAGWASLASVGLWMSAPGSPEATTMSVTLWRTGEVSPQLRTWVAVPAGEPRLIRVPTPLRLSADDAERLSVTLEVASGPVPQIGVGADGKAALGSRGIRPTPLTPPLVGGEPLLPLLADGSPPLPEGSSLTVRDIGAGTLRYGPWGAESLLRWSDDHPGWEIPGPSNRAASWSESTVRSPDGGPIVVRIDSPSAMSSATAHVLCTSFSLEAPPCFVEGSTDGSAWQRIGEGVGRPLRLAHATGTLPLNGATQAFFRIDISEGSAATVVNGAWFDATLSVPLAGSLSTIGTDQLALPADGGPRVRAVAAAAPEGTMALALSAQRLSQWLIRGAGPIQAWLLAVLSLAGALIAARRGLGELVPPLLCTALICVLQGVLPLHSASTILGS